MSKPNSAGGDGGGNGNNGPHNQNGHDPRGAATGRGPPWGGPSFSNVVPSRRGSILKEIISNGSNTNPSSNYRRPNN
ncbi:hypothetical protein Syun_014384 [Stephania yunnanensis]|uniref:Uncharacterized protein n=1 Tax=Stephania yunnanensis TaxID=152371 RepID=A0AAP0P9I2_9MAGN